MGVSYAVKFESIHFEVFPGTMSSPVSFRMVFRFEPVDDLASLETSLKRDLRKYLLLFNNEFMKLMYLEKIFCFACLHPDILSIKYVCVCIGKLEITLRFTFQLLISCLKFSESKFQRDEPVK